MKKLVSLLMCAMLLLSLVPSMAAASADEQVIIRIFDKNSGSYTFDDPVAQEIEARTGVKIVIENPTGDPLEKLNLMLTGGTYPDLVLMQRSDDIVNRYIEAGALLPLNDLIDAYAPNVKAMYGDLLAKITQDDGNIYYLSSYYGLDPDASSGVLIRRDLLAEVVGEERAYSNDWFTQSEFIEILRQFKALHPDGIGMTFNAETASYYTKALYGMYGIKTFYDENGDGQLQLQCKNPKFLEAMKFLNTLYTEGLLEKEWVTNKKDQWVQKCASGNVFATFCSYWSTNDANTSLAATIGPEAQFMSYKVVPDNMDHTETLYNGRNSLGNDAIAITKNCQNPEAVMKVIDFLASEEGQYLLMWGIEGKDWNLVDGVHTPVQAVVDGFNTDWTNTIINTGIRKWTWFIKNGKGADGTWYDVTKVNMGAAEAWANESFEETDLWDMDEFVGLEPSGSSLEALYYQKITDDFNQMFPNIINASSNEEAEKLYNQMIDTLNNDGAEIVEAYITQKYQQRMAQWGL